MRVFDVYTCLGNKRLILPLIFILAVAFSLINTNNDDYGCKGTNSALSATLSSSECVSDYGTVRIMGEGRSTCKMASSDSADRSASEYTFYEDPECTMTARTKSGENAILSAGENGNAEEIELKAGLYYVKEICPTEKSATETVVHTVLVVKDKVTTSVRMTT